MIKKPNLVTFDTNPSNDKSDKEKATIKNSKVKVDSFSDSGDEVQFEDYVKGSQ